MKIRILAALILVGLAAPLAAQTTIAGSKGPNVSAPSATKNVPTMPAVACSSAQVLTVGRVVFPCVDVNGSLWFSLRNSDGTAATVPQDATAGSTASATGPQVMGDCDDTATVAGVENAAARLRVDCTTRALLTEPTASATQPGTSECVLISAASTNATNCKASAGNFYGVQLVNTTATLYYLRLYNLAASPTCSSATGFIRTIPVPASTSGAGVVITLIYPIAYSAGIGFCFTGGSSSTDNTSAATGVFGVVLFK